MCFVPIHYNAMIGISTPTVKPNITGFPIRAAVGASGNRVADC